MVSILCTGMALPLYQAQLGWTDYQFECTVDLRRVDPGRGSCSLGHGFKSPYVTNGLEVRLNPGSGAIFCELFHVPRKESPSMTFKF